MHRRVLPVAIAASLLTIGLAGCTQPSSNQTGSAGVTSGTDCVNPLKPGVLSDNAVVSAAGVNMNGVSDVVNAQRTVLTDPEQSDTVDHSAVAVPGDIVTANVSIYDVPSGERIDGTENGAWLSLPREMVPEVSAALNSDQSDSLTVDLLIATSLLCASPGETILMGATAQQAVQSQGGSSATLTVIEVLDVFPAQADGRHQTLPNGFPAVTNDETGRPGIVLAPLAPPAEQREAVRIVGEGSVVTPESSVIGQVLSVDWGGNVQLNTWETGMVGFGTEAAANPEFTFRGSLSGLTAGTQVVIIDPSGPTPVVHVVDIVAVA